MSEHDAGTTFRGLPLTEEQDAEIKHYLKRQKRNGEPIDEKELTAMLADMLLPPSQEEGSLASLDVNTRADAERAGASVDETMDTIVAAEDRIAAMESEAMKRASS
jgi:Spy/CpxP family protein refolding chaperone